MTKKLRVKDKSSIRNIEQTLLDIQAIIPDYIAKSEDETTNLYKDLMIAKLETARKIFIEQIKP